MEYSIEIKNLQKSFGDVHAVNDLSFRVKKGELFAFLGVNGAGKSTTISIICGLLAKDGGQVLVDGAEVNGDTAHTKRLGVVFQNSVLDKPLSVRDNLENRAAMYGIYGDAFEKRLADLSERLELGALLKRSVGKLSGGQRRRVDVARALIHQPDVLILDEPTTGLDPQTRKTVWSVIEDLRKKRGMTVLLTTHYMEEAADADYVVILDGGKVVAEGSPIALKNAYTGDFIMLYGQSESVAKSFGTTCEKVSDGYRIAVPNTATATQWIVQNPEIFIDYEIVKGKMDDVFLAVTGKRLGGDEQ